MRTLFLLLLVLCIGLTVLSAQQIDLRGQVSIHNSRYRTGAIEYVPNAAVQAPFAGETSSDTEGMFRLAFDGVAAGTTISLIVEKADLEVVNAREMLQVVLGRKQPLKVFLAKKGELAQRQTELYDVSVSVLTEKHDALIASLRAEGKESANAIRELEQQLNREVEHRYEAEDLIREQLVAAKERLPEMAKRLAEVNLDFASDTYLSAYEAYSRGDIQSALGVLEEEALSGKATEIFRSLEGIDQDQQDYQLALEVELDKASQVYASYALKADAYALVFDYRSAVDVLDKGVDFLEAVKEEDDLELAEAYRNLGATSQELGQYTDALSAQLKSVNIKERLMTPNNTELGTAYNDLAVIYQDLGNYEQALVYQQRSLSIQEQALEQNHLKTATSYYNLASIYRSMGHYEKALVAQQKDIDLLLKEVDPTHSMLANSYNSLAMIHLSLGNYEQALSTQLMALSIEEEKVISIHPSIATSHNNLASIYQAMGDAAEALLEEQKALAILTEILEPNHPDIAITYSNLGAIYRDLGKYNKAMAAQQQALVLQVQTLGVNHPDVATSYNNLAQTHFDLSNYQEAFNTQRKAISIQETVLEADHPSRATSYHNMVYFFANLNQLDSAIVYENKAYSIWKTKLPSDSSEIETVENNFVALYTRRALLRFGKEQYELAIVDFNQAIKFSEEPGELFNLVGLAYYQAGEYKMAIENYEKSYHYAGIDEVTYVNNKGMAYAKWGNLMAAKQLFNQLEELVPNGAFIYYDWALYYTLAGDYDIALTKLEEVIQTGYYNWEWLQTEKALDPLRKLPRFQALLEQAPTENK